MRRKEVCMKVVKLAVLVLTIVALGCGSNSSSSGKNATLQGNWTITASGNGQDSVFSVSLIPSACTVSTPVGTFTVQAATYTTVCAIADNNTGQGSISGAGQFIYPPQGVLLGNISGFSSSKELGAAASPVSLLFVEADQDGNIAVFDGQGNTGDNPNIPSISGTWTCDPKSPVCAGMSGTFSGTMQ